MQKKYTNKKIKNEETKNKVESYTFPDGKVIKAASLEEATEIYKKSNSDSKKEL